MYLSDLPHNIQQTSDQQYFLDQTLGKYSFVYTSTIFGGPVKSLVCTKCMSLVVEGGMDIHNRMHDS